MFATSHDRSEIYYEVTGNADTALVFVHGWLGNVRWWDAQRDAFAPTHQVVALDLAGHGRSARTRTCHSAEAYAQDIVAVVHALAASRVILVAHSMSGAYALLAAPMLGDRLAALILVDTVKNLDALPPRDQTDAMLANHRADYRSAVTTVLPRFLFSPQTPAAVAERLTREFLTVTGDTAADLLEPAFRVDLREAARGVRVPVRGIGGDLQPGNIAANRAYLRDYDSADLAGCGHYPMLEQPDAFDAALCAALARLSAAAN